MPSGKTHDTIAVVTLIPLSMAVFFAAHQYITAIYFGLGYLFGSCYLSPDLDTHSLPYKRWGVFRYIWIPYQKFGGHRSSLSFSHDLFLGFFVRALYLSIILFLICLFCFLIYLYINYSITQDFTLLDLLDYILSGLRSLYIFVFEYKVYFLYCLFGMWLGNTIHILSDWVAGINKKLKVKGL